MGMATFILDEARRKEQREFKPVVPTPPSAQKPPVIETTPSPVSTSPAVEEKKPEEKAEPAPMPEKAEDKVKSEIKAESKSESKPESKPEENKTKLRVRKDS